MTKKEASIFFPAQEGDDLHDLFEERLFEFKRFFISNTALRKVFDSKVQKLKQIHQAYLVLSNSKDIQQEDSVTNFDFNFSNNILDAYRKKEKIKGELKNDLLKSDNIHTVLFYAGKLIELEESYNQNWNTILITEEPVNLPISKEPDPMELLQAILEFNKTGGINYSDMNTLRELVPETLMKEAKRLYLYQKKNI